MKFGMEVDITVKLSIYFDCDCAIMSKDKLIMITFETHTVQIFRRVLASLYGCVRPSVGNQFFVISVFLLKSLNNISQRLKISNNRTSNNTPTTMSSNSPSATTTTKLDASLFLLELVFLHYKLLDLQLPPV